SRVSPSSRVRRTSSGSKSSVPLAKCSLTWARKASSFAAFTVAAVASKTTYASPSASSEKTTVSTKPCRSPCDARVSMLGSARYLLGRKRAWLSNRLLSLCLLLCSTAVGCASRGDVVRRRGDVQRESRAISPVAYAWYVRGLYHERAG